MIHSVRSTRTLPSNFSTFFYDSRAKHPQKTTGAPQKVANGGSLKSLGLRVFRTQVLMGVQQVLMGIQQVFYSLKRASEEIQ